MKTIRPPRASSQRGITMLEMTLVIGVLLTLLTILFVGTRAWKSGSDRASCILTLRNIQLSVRSYQNIYGYNPGGRPYAVDGSQDITRQLLDNGYIDQSMFEQASGTKPCVGGGSYQRTMADVFPLNGALYAECSLAAAGKHTPLDSSSW